MSPAAELKAAAAKLRGLAAAATPGPWESDDWEIYGPGRAWVGETFTDDDETGDPNAAYIAAMHPAVGLAVADWLDHTADLIAANQGRFEGTQSSAFAVLTARAINGEVTSCSDDTRPLVSEHCLAGRHLSCDGALCTCDCHQGGNG